MKLQVPKLANNSSSIKEKNMMSLFDKYVLGPSTSIFSTPIPGGKLYPEQIDATDIRALEFLERLDKVRNKPWEEYKILDVGCNEGASSFVLGQSGAHVIGIEGRADSVRRAEYVRDQLGFKNVEFYAGNVMDRSLWQPVDAVFAAGILYHLDRPFEFFDLIGEFSRQGVFFCTHCAPETQEQLDRTHFKKVLKNDLHTELFHGEPIEVMTYSEPADIQEIQANGKRRHPRSSVGTNISVWVTKEGLVKAMTTLGYRYHQDIEGNLATMRFRTVFLKDEPSESKSQSPLLLSQPLPDRPSLEASAAQCYQEDINYCREQKAAVTLVGMAPFTDIVAKDLHDNGISVAETLIFDLKDTPSQAAVWRQLQAQKPTYVVLALPKQNLNTYHQHIMLLNFASYIFTSFAVKTADSPTLATN